MYSHGTHINTYRRAVVAINQVALATFSFFFVVIVVYVYAACQQGQLCVWLCVCVCLCVARSTAKQRVENTENRQTSYQFAVAKRTR